MTLKPKLNLRQKLWKGLGSPVIDVSLKKDRLLVDVLKFSEFFAGLCGSKVVKGRDYDTKRTGSTLGFDLLSF